MHLLLNGLYVKTHSDMEMFKSVHTERKCTRKKDFLNLNGTIENSCSLSLSIGVNELYVSRLACHNCQTNFQERER